MMRTAGLLLLLAVCPVTSGRPLSPPPPNPSELTDAYLDRVYCVGMAAGNENFALRIWCRSRPGQEEAILMRLAAAASCLEEPGELPIDTSEEADPQLRSILTDARAHLAELHTELQSGYATRPDFNDEYSPAFEEELQRRITAYLRNTSLYARLRAAYREALEPGSCANEFLAWMQARQRPVPPEEQWKLVIDVCAGPPDDLRRHIVFHAGLPGIDPERYAALQRLTQFPDFFNCLAADLATDTGLSTRVLGLDGHTSAKEYVDVRGSVHARWEELGVPGVVQELSLTADEGRVFRRLRERCRVLLGRTP